MKHIFFMFYSPIFLYIIASIWKKCGANPKNLKEGSGSYIDIHAWKMSNCTYGLSQHKEYKFPLLCIYHQGRSQTFQNKIGGAYWDSKWQLSIDPCTKCHFMGAQGGARILTEGVQAPPPPSGYTPVHHMIT